MERKRCQVCEGPVVNGRCKLCGMPYRNDETLYHLNENRSEHYRHATSRARAIMRQEEIPLGDKKVGNVADKAGKGNVKNAAGAGYKSLTGTANTYNKGNVKQKSTYGSSYGTGKNANKTAASTGNVNSQNRQTTAGIYNTANKKGGVYTQKPVKKKKGSLLGWLVLLAVICANVPEIRDSLRDTLEPAIEKEFGNIFGSDSAVASYEVEMGDVLEVGEDVDGGIAPGYYIASCDEGFVTFMILGEDGKTGNITVTDGVERKITLKEGDLLGIINGESEDSSLLLTAK